MRLPLNGRHVSLRPDFPEEFRPGDNLCDGLLRSLSAVDLIDLDGKLHRRRNPPQQRGVDQNHRLPHRFTGGEFRGTQ